MGQLIPDNLDGGTFFFPLAIEVETVPRPISVREALDQSVDFFEKLIDPSMVTTTNDLEVLALAACTLASLQTTERTLLFEEIKLSCNLASVFFFFFLCPDLSEFHFGGR
mmetsp:Transcript_6780/g.18951  ORF Transcript_6780/g.18951 Transcript_6780/m.18951 type:complete len:110 (+) Transcript_6780:1073-1402(+)